MRQFKMNHLLLPGCRLIVLLVGSLFISSCTSNVGNYCPKPKLAKGAAPGVTFTNPVCIINAQESTEEHDLKFMGIVVNYHEFTQALVDALTAELTKNGSSVIDGAEKALYVSVRKVEIPPIAMTYKAYIDVDIKMGDGALVRLSTDRSSYASPFNVSTAPTKPLDAAFRDMVKEILSNEQIQTYVNNEN